MAEAPTTRASLLVRLRDAGAGDKMVRVWDVDDKPHQTFTGYSGRLMALACVPAGKTLRNSGTRGQQGARSPTNESVSVFKTSRLISGKLS
jgi:hypothetical protein